MVESRVIAPLVVQLFFSNRRLDASIAASMAIASCRGDFFYNSRLARNIVGSRVIAPVLGQVFVAG